MSLKQAAAGLAPKKRFRRKSLDAQVQFALDHAEVLAKVPVAERGESYISEMKLTQVRISTLARLRADKFRKFNDELKAVKAENQVLKSEIERLKVELAAALAKPAVRSDVDHVEQVLARFKAETGGAQ